MQEQSVRSSYCAELGSIAPLEYGEGPELRQFCLDTIAEAFGHGYRADWHQDLDDLCGTVHDYQPDRGGTFLVARRGQLIVGCAGLRAMAARPGLLQRFAHRYPEPDRVGSVWRVYVAPTMRSRGLGQWLVEQLERSAIEHGYRTLYLHTAADSPRSLAFWRSHGYTEFDTGAADDEGAVHLEKALLAPRGRLAPSGP